MLIRDRRKQFGIDMAFGALFLLPLLYWVIMDANQMFITFSIGAGAGYFLYVTQKVLVFRDMQQEVEETVGKTAETEVADRVEEATDEMVEEKAQEVVEEQAEETVEKQFEEKTSEIDLGSVENGDSQ